MKALNLVLVFLILSITIAMAVEGGPGDRGHGGGGICFADGRCLTLAEAGLRIRSQNTNSQYWIPTSTVLTALDQIRTALPIGGTNLENSAVGTMYTFQPVEEVDPRLFQRVRNEYTAIMRQNGFAPGDGSFEIFAISTKGNSAITYLLPSFWRLTPRQQALILIHEGNIRSDVTLEQALLFDRALLDNIGTDRSHADQLVWLGAIFNTYFAELSFTGNSRERLARDKAFFKLVFAELERKAGRPLTLADFLSATALPHLRWSSTGGMSPVALARWTPFDARVPFMFGYAEYSQSTKGQPLDVLQRERLRAALCQGISASGDLTSYRLYSTTTAVNFIDCSPGTVDAYNVPVPEYEHEFVITNINYPQP